MKSFNFILALVVSILSAVACGIKLWFEYGLWSLACYAAIFLALPVSVVLHELGHILIGAICGIKAVPQFSLFGSSSVRLMPKTDKGLRCRLFFTAAGGLAVNLVLVIVGIIAVIFGVLPVWLCVFLPSSVYLFILNAVSDDKTDGKVCSMLLSNSNEAVVTIAVMQVQAQVLKGKPIEEVDENLLFGLPVICEDEPAFISLTELRYEYFAAKGDEEQAQKYKTRLEQLKEEYL